MRVDARQYIVRADHCAYARRVYGQHHDLRWCERHGYLLSANQTVAFTIVSGQSNTVSLTLNGVPHQILISSLTNAATLSGSTYTLAGPIAASFEVAALDVDGDIIFGAGAPTFTISQTSGSAMTGRRPDDGKAERIHADAARRQRRKRRIHHHRNVRRCDMRGKPAPSVRRHWQR